MSEPLKLSQLTSALEGFFEKRFSGRTFWVLAEVSSHKPYPSKRWHFFDLIEKDAKSDRLVAKMQAVAWRQGFDAIQRFEHESGQRLTNGIEVMVQAEVSFSAMYGLKLTVIDIDPAYTMGQMELKRRETLKKLVDRYPQFIQKVGDQYHTLNQRQELPMIIKKVALITSPGAAGYEDFMHSLEKNQFGYTFSIDLYFARVQGMQAAKTLKRRIAEIAAQEEEYDLMVMVRGGGAQTDLFVFDEFELNREIARAKVPMWAGIGHQRDHTIVDLFSHSSHKTPTRVAEAIIQHNRSAEEYLAGARERLLFSVKDEMVSHREKLLKASRVLTSDVPARLHHGQLRLASLSNQLQSLAIRRIDRQREGLGHFQKQLSSVSTNELRDQRRLLSELSSSIGPTVLRKMEREKERLAHRTSLVKMLDPANLLKRGYTLLEKEGKLITDFSSIQEKDKLDVLLNDGRLSVEVKKKEPK
ncbi:MAG: exodeoxyribonuclease VII large subunit [Flavobacteriales bacterium]|nr:exodeoxyribonuclease VII large subunit [Flavobacteriales bacterium]MDG1780985.1 exodeoxyribonuclease VII large subunit [Flavobacteriales bacterium]MDG2246971.1 exodeoxyribonuclease VII large subunit [Flavobacteriales bacterium]